MNSCAICGDPCIGNQCGHCAPCFRPPANEVWLVNRNGSIAARFINVGCDDDQPGNGEAIALGLISQKGEAQ